MEVEEKNMGKKNKFCEEELVERIEACVKDDEAYLNPNLTLEELAKAVGSNRSYVSGVISKEWGSFTNYINGYRVEKAMCLLEEQKSFNSSEKMEDVAILSGFSSSRQMRKYMIKHKKE